MARVEKPACVRCVKPTVATSKQNIKVFGSEWFLHLCDAHAERFQSDIWSWLRIGYEVEDTSETARIRELAAISRSHALERPAPPLPELRVDTAIDLPEQAKRWTFTDHACDQVNSRKLNPDLALMAAAFPEKIVAHERPGRQVRHRGDLAVVVEPADRLIVTVLYGETHAGHPLNAGAGDTRNGSDKMLKWRLSPRAFREARRLGLTQEHLLRVAAFPHRLRKGKRLGEQVRWRDHEEHPITLIVDPADHLVVGCLEGIREDRGVDAIIECGYARQSQGVSA